MYVCVCVCVCVNNFGHQITHKVWYAIKHYQTIYIYILVKLFLEGLGVDFVHGPIK